MSGLDNIKTKVETWIDTHDLNPGNGKAQKIADKKVNKALLEDYGSEILQGIGKDDSLNEEEKLKTFHQANQHFFSYVSLKKSHPLLQEMAASCHRWSQSALCEKLPKWAKAIQEEKISFQGPDIEKDPEISTIKALSDYENLPQLKNQPEKYQRALALAREAQENFSPVVRAFGKYAEEALVKGDIAYVQRIITGIGLVQENPAKIYALLDARQKGKIILSGDIYTQTWANEDHTDELMDLLEEMENRVDNNEKLSDEEKLEEKVQPLLPFMLQQNKAVLEKLAGKRFWNGFNSQDFKEIRNKIFQNTNAKEQKQQVNILAHVFDQALQAHLEASLRAGIPKDLALLEIAFPHEYFHILQKRHYEGENLKGSLPPVKPEDHYFLALNLYMQRQERAHPIAGTVRAVNIISESGFKDKLLEMRQADEKTAEDFGRNVARAMVLQRKINKTKKMLQPHIDYAHKNKSTLSNILWGGLVLMIP